jgi:alkylation response protein AidB-like acyl-CoA dehydrogenase
MADGTFLDWPFFEDRHRAFAGALDRWAAGLVVDHADTDAACRELVRRLGADGWLAPTGAGEGERLDVRMLCLAREVLARHDGLADFAFAMQGLGMGAVTLFGTPVQREWLARTRAGEAIAGFALTEPRSGSDVANSAMTAVRDGDGWRLDGEKTWISNGGIADVYTVFARTGEAPGAKGLSAFLVPADTPGLTVAERLETVAPHPLATLRFEGVRVPAEALIGEPGAGFRIAMTVLDHFRPTVAAAALGLRAAGAGRGGGAGEGAGDRRAASGGDADGAGASCRHGGGGRCGGAPRLPGGLGEGPRAGADHAGGGDGEALLHRGGAEGHRHGGAAAWRGRGAEGVGGESGFTGRSGRFGSTRAQATCSGW